MRFARRNYSHDREEEPISGRLIAALLLVYIFWGSTYLAIARAIESFPPFFMAGSRFLVAGAVLFGYLRFIRGERIGPGVWKAAWIMGALLLLGGNGGVCYAEQYVPSGVTALMVGSGPFWFALLAWLWLKGPRPGPLAIIGLLVGFSGLAILIGPSNLTGAARQTPLIPSLVVVGAALSWSIGSIYSKTLRLDSSPMMMSALQMLAGFVLLTGAGFLRGEHVGFHVQDISLESWLAWVYLVIFGSLVGFSAYIYVLRHASPALASTYAYVNPVVAVFIGWAVGGEELTSRTLMAAVLIIGAVVLISWPTRRKVLVIPGEEHRTVIIGRD